MTQMEELVVVIPKSSEGDYYILPAPGFLFTHCVYREQDLSDRLAK